MTMLSSIRVRALAVMLCLTAASTLGHQLRPSIHLADQLPKMDLEAAFPAQFAEWRVDTNVPLSIVSPDVQAQLDQIYKAVLSRTYINDRGDRIMLSVAYGGDQASATRAHRPDVCYPAQGFDISQEADSSIQLPNELLPVRHLVATQGQRVEPITFWFAIGKYVAVSGHEQKSAEFRYGLKGLIPDGMLVRVSNISNNSQEAFALQTRFVVEMEKAFDKKWTPRVFGTESLRE